MISRHRGDGGGDANVYTLLYIYNNGRVFRSSALPITLYTHCNTRVLYYEYEENNCKSMNKFAKLLFPHTIRT